ncbi:MAG: transposase [Planctomycetes bacterium]|nr:transposase [Planctomycetota bacterium]
MACGRWRRATSRPPASSANSARHAHAEAFASFGGLPRTIVYDNMTTVTLGRSAGKPIWNPGFLDFARHFGFTPRACRPRDPDRKGKIERPFSWIDADLLRGTEFTSRDEFRLKTREWLDTVANARVHATTKRVPAEALLEERPSLIRLPEVASPAVARSAIRKVASDGTVCVDASFYPVPAALVGQCVSVRVFPDRIEVLDASGAVVAAHRIPDVPGRVSIDGPRPSREPVPRGALEVRFLTLFPEAAVFLDGLLRRMKGLSAIHLRKLERLAELHGEKPVREAIERATRYRNWSADAIGRILEARAPDLFEPPPVPPLTGHPTVLAALDDIPVADLSDYTLDSMPPTPPTPDPKGTSDDDPDDRPF